ncbi:MAG: helix-turn-helix transcriptional regulator, partial [Pseudonocardiales bacterium]|nr:helix-turn-helix transcriptional regulator [Pseudonocardiales bacterium]
LLALARALQGQPDAPEPAPAGPAAPAQPAAADGPVAAFSERELEIGRHILDGLTYKQIGQRLYVSAKTVEHHVARMRQRLGVASRDELFGLLRTALEAGARR